MSTNGVNEDQQLAIRQSARGEIVTSDGMGASAIERHAETSATAVAERAKAEVNARFLMALQRPRDVDDARVRLMAHCKRARFAEKARYSKPMGGTKIEGPTIRFVETALQEYGNVYPSTSVMFDDEDSRIVRVCVTDLERNITYHKDVQFRKAVERTNASGREVISQRRNSNNKTTYLVRATEDELLALQGSLESKAIRTLGLRILPADIVDEAMDQCVRTQHSDVKRDPGKAKKRIADSFASLNITPSKLKEAGYDLDVASPDELLELRAIYEAISNGDARWSDVAGFRAVVEGADDAPKKPSKGTAAILAKRDERKARTEANAVIDVESTEAAAE